MLQRTRPEPAKPYSVLLVDFHPDTLALYSEYFRSRGFVTLTASRGLEALRLAARRQPDLVCTSYRLEQIDGADLTARLKAGKQTASIPVIVLTTFVSPTDLARARESGADAVLIKPILPEHLVAEALRLLGTTEQS